MVYAALRIYEVENVVVNHGSGRMRFLLCPPSTGMGELARSLVGSWDINGS